jgi:aminoglycoside/choline kinase family phosphotransferase
MLELLVTQAHAIAARLSDSPATLLHGDYWPGNLVIYPDRRLYVIDWQRAGVGPGILDLFTFIQSSLWWFERLPVDPTRIIQRYREGLEVACGQRWSDEEWNVLWDYALMWNFLIDWVDLLGSIPNSILKTRWTQLENCWLEPLRQATYRHLVR